MRRSVGVPVCHVTSVSVCTVRIAAIQAAG